MCACVCTTCENYSSYQFLHHWFFCTITLTIPLCLVVSFFTFWLRKNIDDVCWLTNYEMEMVYIWKQTTNEMHMYCTAIPNGSTKQQRKRRAKRMTITCIQPIGKNNNLCLNLCIHVIVTYAHLHTKLLVVWMHTVHLYVYLQ